MTHSNSPTNRAIRKERIFSIHKLIEYGFSSPQTRTRIIENAMVPPTYIMDTKYPDIERGAAAFLNSNCLDDSRLLGLDKSYLQRKPNTEHEEQRLLNAHDAIEHVRRMDWSIPKGSTIQLVGGEAPDYIEISGLRVRVKSTNILTRAAKGLSPPSIGVGKPYFGKCFPLHVQDDRERGVLFATLLHWYAEEKLGKYGNPDPALCFVGDIFSEKVHFAANRYKQRRKQLEALAQEITDRWEAIRLRLVQNADREKVTKKV